MNYKKSAFLIVLTALAICIVAAVCFLRKPEIIPASLDTVQTAGAKTTDMHPEESAEKADILSGDRLLDYLASLPENGSELAASGSFVISNNGKLYGADHLSEFLKKYHAGQPAALVFCQYTVEGDLLLYYAGYDGDRITLTRDWRRDKWGGNGARTDAVSYRYLMLLEWTGNDGAVYEDIVLTDDPEMNAEKKRKILEADQPAEGSEKLFECIGTIPKDKNTLPPYEYRGSDPIEAAITEYFLAAYGTKEENAVTIPAFCIFMTEIDKDNQDMINVYGNFWLLSYQKNGTVLECIGGGEHPGVIHLMKDGEGYLVRFEQAGDGSFYGEDIKSFCKGNTSLEKQYFEAVDAGKDPVLSKRVWYIRQYAEQNGSDIDSYKDYGWDPVKLADVISNWVGQEEQTVSE